MAFEERERDYPRQVVDLVTLQDDVDMASASNDIIWLPEDVRGRVPRRRPPPRAAGAGVTSTGRACSSSHEAAWTSATARVLSGSVPSVDR